MARGRSGRGCGVGVGVGQGRADGQFVRKVNEKMVNDCTQTFIYCLGSF